MAKTKKELEADLEKLSQENHELREDLADLADLAVAEIDQSEPVKVSGSELLNTINGFEGAVSDLKHLELKINSNSGNKVLNKQYDGAKIAVNNFLKKLKVTV